MAFYLIPSFVIPAEAGIAINFLVISMSRMHGMILREKICVTSTEGYSPAKLGRSLNLLSS